MINLDTNYQKERLKDIAEQNAVKKQQVNVHKTILTALDQMKQSINKNQHLQENLRKHLLSSTNHINSHKFEIEQIYSKNNTKSQLKHAFHLTSLNDQRRKIRNTLKTYNIHTEYDFAEEKPVNIYALNNRTGQRLATQQSPQQARSLTRFSESPNLFKGSQTPSIPSHPSSANPNQRQSNFFLTNPQLQSGRISQNSFKIRAKDKTKTQISYISETQCGSPENTSRAMTTIHNQNSQQMITLNNEKLQLDSLHTSPYMQPLSTAGSSTNTFNLKLNQSNHRSSSNYTHFTVNNYNNPTQHQQTTEQDNTSLLSNKHNTQLSSSNLFNSNLFSVNRSKGYKSIPSSPPNSIQQQFQFRFSEPNEKPKIRASSAQQRTFETIQNEDEIIIPHKQSQEMNEEEIEEDKSPILSIPAIKDTIQEEKENKKNTEEDDNFFIEPKQFYYIDNNEMQSVQEFMYRMHKYEQYKRFEQFRLEKKQRANQIKDVQQLLLFRSEKAAREVAKANVRKYIMKHKIHITDKEIDEWVEKIKVEPLETNQRLTFRECNRQVISFQLMGTDQEKEFFKIQREIDKALNKINRPVKFIQQYQIYLNNKKKNFSNINMTSNQISMALINQLPSQYLINKPPPSFFQQNSQSMNKIGSLMSLKFRDSQHSINQIQSRVSRVIETEEREE